MDSLAMMVAQSRSQLSPCHTPPMDALVLDKVRTVLLGMAVYGDMLAGAHSRRQDNKEEATHNIGRRTSACYTASSDATNIPPTEGQTRRFMRKNMEKADVPGYMPPQRLYKTELCRTFEDTGECSYRHRCKFAHGEAELREIARHPRYKTEPCVKYHRDGVCEYGSRCRFVHDARPGV